MLKKIAILATVGIAGFLAYAATLPAAFSISRSVSIAAAPDKIFQLINDFHGFNRWNPFLKDDPAIKLSYSGPDSGKGAKYDWDGNSNVGKGNVEITGSTPASKILMNLNMMAPMEAHNRVEFTLEPKGVQTQVTWTMSGENSFIGKVMSACFNADKMVGGAFEQGLAELKTIAEK
jgi:Polyketide cyclase / dehydrase and lipid transport